MLLFLRKFNEFELSHQIKIQKTKADECFVSIFVFICSKINLIAAKMSLDIASSSSKSSSLDADDTDDMDEKESEFKREPILSRTRSGRCIKVNSEYTENYAMKKQQQNLYYQVKKALDKPVEQRSKDDQDLIANCKDLVDHADLCRKNRLLAAKHQEIVVDDADTLAAKCAELADAIRKANCCVVYTGAGISTSASIPDYRGPNGLWTMLERGVKVDLPDFSLVEPTYSHMVLSTLMDMGLVKHIVSQNCG